MGQTNYFPKPLLRTIKVAKTIYDRKRSGETLESIREDLGYSRLQCSRLYNWYKDWVIPAGKGDDFPKKGER